MTRAAAPARLPEHLETPVVALRNGFVVVGRTAGGGFLLEHRVVAERMLGRPLHRRERVRHRNGDKTDNRPENLEIVGRGEEWRWVCAHCGRTFRPTHHQRRNVGRGDQRTAFCSMACRHAVRRGHGGGRGWRFTRGGYVLARVVVDGRRRFVLEHRLVMAGWLGRPLRPDEHIHHLNGRPADNWPENLRIVTNPEHARITNAGRDYSRPKRALVAP